MLFSTFTMCSKTVYRVPLRVITTSSTEAKEAFEELSRAVRSTFGIRRDHALDMIAFEHCCEAGEDCGCVPSPDDFDDVYRPDSGCNINRFCSLSREYFAHDSDSDSVGTSCE